MLHHATQTVLDSQGITRTTEPAFALGHDLGAFWDSRGIAPAPARPFAPVTALASY